jgi:hypothetical protein
LWVELDIQKIVSATDEFLVRLRRMRNLKSDPTYINLEAKIKAFQDSLPLIQVILCSNQNVIRKVSNDIIYRRIMIFKHYSNVIPRGLSVPPDKVSTNEAYEKYTITCISKSAVEEIMIASS